MDEATLPGTRPTAIVVEVVADILGLPAECVPADADLVSLPGVSSLALMRIVERLEDRLGREFPPDAMVAATFASPARLAAAFRAPGTREPADADGGRP